MRIGITWMPYSALQQQGPFGVMACCMVYREQQGSYLLSPPHVAVGGCGRGVRFSSTPRAPQAAAAVAPAAAAAVAVAAEVLRRTRG